MSSNIELLSRDVADQHCLSSLQMQTGGMLQKIEYAERHTVVGEKLMQEGFYFHAQPLLHLALAVVVRGSCFNLRTVALFMLCNEVRQEMHV